MQLATAQNNNTEYTPNAITAFIAKIISYIFHPLFIPTYIFGLLMVLMPYEFPSIEAHQLKLRLFSVFWMTAFFPAFAVFLLWRLQLINSIYLHTSKERIIPFFITMFFYWWMFYLSKNFTDQPLVLKFFFLGIFIATPIGVVINNYIKISLHSMAISGAVTAIILFSFYYKISLGLPILISLFIAGIVCTSRLVVKQHTTKEIYVGLLVGSICQLIAYWFIM